MHIAPFSLPWNMFLAEVFLAGLENPRKSSVVEQFFRKIPWHIWKEISKVTLFVTLVRLLVLTSGSEKR